VTGSSAAAIEAFGIAGGFDDSAEAFMNA